MIDRMVLFLFSEYNYKVVYQHRLTSSEFSFWQKFENRKNLNHNSLWVLHL